MKINFNIREKFRSVRHSLDVLKNNWIVSVANKFVLISFGLTVAIIAVRWRSLPPAVPLWYTRPWGMDQLTHPGWLIMIPVASILWHAVNIMFSVYLIREHKIFIRLMFITSFFVSLISFIAVTKIIFLVT
jgi:hypothetical protein